MNNLGKRENHCAMVVGRPRVGKTTLTIEVINKYSDKRPVLIFDSKFDEKYNVFESVRYDVTHEDFFQRTKYITELVKLNESRKRHKDLYPKALIRRIIPFLPNGRPMSDKQKKLAFDDVLASFKNGLIVADDIFSFLEMNKTIHGALTTYAHDGLDLLFMVQSSKSIPPKFLQYASLWRLHRQTDSFTLDPGRYGTLYPILRIAEIIVEMMFTKDPYYFLYVDVRDYKIIMEKNRNIQAAALIEFINENPKYKRLQANYKEYFN